MSWEILVIGLIAGTLSGFFGIGGGILIIPALVLFCGFTQKLAQGTSLAAMIPPIGILAAIAYWKAGNINIKAAILIALGFLIGAFIGSIGVCYISETLLRKLFAVLLIFAAVKIWMG